MQCHSKFSFEWNLIFTKLIHFFHQLITIGSAKQHGAQGEHSKLQRSALAEVNAFSKGSEASPQVNNIEWHRINPTPCHNIAIDLIWF
jgi:hypothetical protein